MKTLIRNRVIALVTTLLIASGMPVVAEEQGFTLEDSIRSQIFQELKSNVESLYRNSQLVVADIDTSKASHIAANNGSRYFAPAGTSVDQQGKNKQVKNIN
jgi:hypothetical protein